MNLRRTKSTIILILQPNTDDHGHLGGRQGRRAIYGVASLEVRLLSFLVS